MIHLLKTEFLGEERKVSLVKALKRQKAHGRMLMLMFHILIESKA